MFKNKKKIAELEAKLDSQGNDLTLARQTADRYVDAYNNQTSQYEAILSNKDQAIKELNDRIREMEQKELLYRKYYKLDEEPSEETIVKIRTDLKVHELEMAVMKYELAERNRIDNERSRFQNSIMLSQFQLWNQSLIQYQNAGCLIHC